MSYVLQVRVDEICQRLLDVDHKVTHLCAVLDELTPLLYRMAQELDLEDLDDDEDPSTALTEKQHRTMHTPKGEDNAKAPEKQTS